MSPDQPVYTSTAETSRFLNRNGQFAYRDPKFLEEELYLDDAVDHGRPELAFEVESSLINRLKKSSYASEGLARVSLKAIAVAQYARQATPDTHHKVGTYRNLGLLLDKTLAEKNRLHYGPEGHQYIPHKRIIGALAEIAVFTLLSYDGNLKHTLTGRSRTTPEHYTLPSSIAEDKGHFPIDGVRTGFDFKLFTPDESQPVLPLQVKSTLHHTNKHEYTPEITVVSLDAIADVDSQNESVLPELLRDDAFGHRTRTSRLQINAASRSLDRMIRFN